VETSFSGYVKEFKWWNYKRSDFYVDHFKHSWVESGDTRVIASWRMDEDSLNFNQGADSFTYLDFGEYELTYTIPSTDNWNMVSQSVFSPFTINFCDPGYYSLYNVMFLFYECLPCNDECRECDGSDADECISCPAGFVLWESSQTCLAIEECPDGQILDPITDFCIPCNLFCATCVDTTDNCPTCLEGALKDPTGTDCVSSCTDDATYGDTRLQICFNDPLLYVLKPEDDSKFSYDDFITLKGDYETLNNEDYDSMEFGWKVL
jgi:hypothetical protein